MHPAPRLRRTDAHPEGITMNHSNVLRAGGIFALLLFSSIASAQSVVVIDDDLDELPPGFSLVTDSSTNATSSLQFGPVGNSTGLVFDGSWDVPGGGREFAISAMTPVIPTVDDFQFNPTDVDGIRSIRWMLDLAVTSATMVPPEQGVFAQLVVFQHQADGTVMGFPDDGFFVQVGDTVTLDKVALETDFGLPGMHPDFSPGGRSMSFGLQIGAAYPRDLMPEAFFVDGRMTADNWKVEVLGGLGGVFKDGFEEGLVVRSASSRPVRQSHACNCTVPNLTLSQPRQRSR